MDFIEFLMDLHPNALVAWDLAGHELPEGYRIRFDKWDLGGWYEGPGSMHPRDDGIGAILIKQHDSNFNHRRFILIHDLLSPLGVSWYTDG
jgi:hypothetical protein